jgi:hypothetical protein
MALMTRSKKKPVIKKSLILHIGSDRVVGALGVFSDTQTPHIVEVAEKQIKVDSHADEMKFMKHFRDAAVHVAQVLSQGGHFVPDHVYVSLESPWFTGQTRTLYYSKKDGFTFTEKLAHTLIDEDFARYKKEGEEKFGEPLSMLDKSVIMTKLNGYQTEEPYGKKTREASISYYASLTPKFFMDSLCEDLERVIRGKIRFFSSSAALSGSLYMTLERYKKLLVIAIGGEVTELLYLENGILINTGTFPSGRNFLIRTLGDQLQQNPLEVFSLLNMCTSGRAHESISKKVDVIVETVEKAWRRHLRKGVLDVVGPIHQDIPVMTIGAPDTLPWFKKMVSNEHITNGSLESGISAKEWGSIISADFFKHKTPSGSLPPLILADCLYIYGIDV